MAAPALLVLAAGMGSRYGGLKQIDPVGPAGELMLDYAVFDALRAGFGRVVFVIRPDFEEIFRAKIGARYAGQVKVDYAFQEIRRLPDDAPPPAGREKPWGTGHAVWCAREALRENFAVINADDFYGADSFRQLHAFLTEARGNQFALAGFRLDRTLSEHGAVSRGICRADEAGFLLSVTEETGITPADVGAGRKFSGQETVSMNCWGFTAGLFAPLDAQLRAFLREHGNEPKAEFYLPAAVSGMIARREAAVRVLPAAGTWFGVTYREDKPRVQAALLERVRSGIYPAKLF